MFRMYKNPSACFAVLTKISLEKYRKIGIIEKEKLSEGETSPMYPIYVVHQVDPEIGSAIQAEMDRQSSHLELIASENFASVPVMSAAGTP